MKCLNTPGTKYCAHLTLFWLLSQVTHWALACRQNPLWNAETRTWRALPVAVRVLSVEMTQLSAAQRGY